MITGFNTDIKFEGVTYHVQTEDKGLDSPLILSLVYVGGAIIASKRTPYEDLVESGYDEKVLTERLQRQHKLICAAIRSGRVEELKRMGAHNGSAESEHADEKAQTTPEVFKVAASGRKKKKGPAPSADGDAPVGAASNDTSKSETSGSAQGVEPDVKANDDLVILTSLMDQVSEVWERSNSFAQAFQPPPIAPPIHEEPPFVAEQDAPAPPWQEELSELPVDDSDDLYLTLLDDEGDFRAGQLATIKVHVGRGTYGQRPVADASVTVKVLGTTFRPMIQMTETDERGVAVVRATLPRFTSGRAAIIIRASQGDDAIEMRRIIHQ